MSDPGWHRGLVDSTSDCHGGGPGLIPGSDKHLQVWDDKGSQHNWSPPPWAANSTLQSSEKVGQLIPFKVAALRKNRKKEGFTSNLISPGLVLFGLVWLDSAGLG